MISDIHIYECLDLLEALILAYQSEISISGAQLNDMSTNLSMIDIYSQSILNISNSTFEQIYGPIVKVSDSEINMKSNNFLNITMMNDNSTSVLDV